eukprot:1147755-Pelagomonas_calceolata.AAC.2
MNEFKKGSQVPSTVAQELPCTTTATFTVLRKRVTLPTSIKEKETHWLIKSREPPPPREKKERQN